MTAVMNRDPDENIFRVVLGILGEYVEIFPFVKNPRVGDFKFFFKFGPIAIGG